MKRITVSSTLLWGIAIATMAAPAWAGNPHFVGGCTATLNTSTNFVSFTGKEAGLGDEPFVDAQYAVIAACINGGGHHPKAQNKTANTFVTNVPVQNGKANLDQVVGPVETSPSCDPPMTLEILSATITDLNNGISESCTVQ